jgi:hypothetical protein
MASIPKDPNQQRERKLTRKQLAAALTEEGYPITDGNLDRLASRGGGPPYELWGQRSLYDWDKALQWAQARLSAPQRKEPPSSTKTKRRHSEANEAATS